MRTKSISLLRRFFTCAAVFCLAAIGLGVEPAQASPPAGQYVADLVDIVLQGTLPMCTGTTHDFLGAFEVSDVTGETVGPFGPVRALQSTTIGKSNIYTGCILNAVDCNTPGGDFSQVWLYRLNYFRIEYTAPHKPGREHLSIDFYDGEFNQLGSAYLEFEVVNCNISLHGTADVGAVANALSPGGTWNFVGSYDVAGTVEMQEGGTNGQGIANMFMDGVATAPQVGCEFTSPIQGDTGVEVQVDPNAWANDGVVKLQVHLEPMPVNVGGIGCTSFGTTINTGSAAVTVASFDLNFPPLPASGGSTSLEFQIPGQPGNFKMDLIVTLEEAES